MKLLLFSSAITIHIKCQLLHIYHVVNAHWASDYEKWTTKCKMTFSSMLAWFFFFFVARITFPPSAPWAIQVLWSSERMQVSKISFWTYTCVAVVVVVVVVCIRHFNSSLKVQYIFSTNSTTILPEKRPQSKFSWIFQTSIFHTLESASWWSQA